MSGWIGVECTDGDTAPTRAVVPAAWSVSRWTGDNDRGIYEVLPPDNDGRVYWGERVHGFDSIDSALTWLTREDEE